MPYISVPAEDVAQPQAEDATLTPGDYTGEPRGFATWQSNDGRRAGLVFAFYNIQNGSEAAIPGRKSHFITTEQPSAQAAAIGRTQLARLGAALNITETDEDGNVFIPGETLDEIVSALEMGTPPGTRLGFRVQDRVQLDKHTKTPQLDAQGNPIVRNEVKSVWALRT